MTSSLPTHSPPPKSLLSFISRFFWGIRGRRTKSAVPEIKDVPTDILFFSSPCPSKVSLRPTVGRSIFPVLTCGWMFF
ncbi:MAG: hypothetical protein Q4C96_07875 [Planctomycetia bacterium]|nr:hypothetical protein [Planctomycetia bacterium]